MLFTIEWLFDLLGCSTPNRLGRNDQDERPDKLLRAGGPAGAAATTCKKVKTSILCLCCPGPSQLGKLERPFHPVMGHEPASRVRGPASCELGMADADCEFITNQSLTLLRSGRSSGPTGRLVAPEFGSTVTPLSHGCYREAHERRERRSAGGGSSSLRQGGVMATRILEGPVRSRGRMPCP